MTQVLSITYLWASVFSIAFNFRWNQASGSMKEKEKYLRMKSQTSYVSDEQLLESSGGRPWDFATSLTALGYNKCLSVLPQTSLPRTGLFSWVSQQHRWRKSCEFSEYEFSLQCTELLRATWLLFCFPKEEGTLNEVKTLNKLVTQLN